MGNTNEKVTVVTSPLPGAELHRFEVYLVHPDARVQTKNGEWVKEILIEVSYDVAKDSLEECDIKAKANAAAKIALDYLKVKRSPVRLAPPLIVGKDSVASVSGDQPPFFRPSPAPSPRGDNRLEPSTEEKRDEDGEPTK